MPEEEREKILTVLGGNRLVELTARTAMETGQRNGELADLGASLTTADAMIAGTGLVFDEPVVTDDEEAFSRFGVEVVTWRN